MTKRGKILRDASAGPGLLSVDGQHYQFSLEGTWRSEAPPAASMTVDVEFSADASIVGISQVSEAQIAKEQAEAVVKAAQQKGGVLASAAIDKFGLPLLIATGLMIMNSLGLAMNFALCSTIVQERAPDYLRGRVSAVFMLSFVGLMPVAGLGVTSLSDFIGMRTALAIASVTYGVITFLILARVRRQCCEPATVEQPPAEATPPVAATI